MTLRVLHDHYDWEHDLTGLEDAVRSAGVPLSVTSVNSVEFPQLLREGNYDVVVRRLNGEPAESYGRLVRECRERGVRVIAESALYPAGSEEILRYFDGYVGLITNGGMQELLRYAR